MAAPSTCVCRGLRKWCGRRCESSSPDIPVGYPAVGFYCSLHSYQKPRNNADGTLTFESPPVEEHTRRRTSFVSPESQIAVELVKSPGIIRDRGAGVPKSATGSAIFDWLVQSRKLDAAAATACAARMLTQGILVPMGDASRGFLATKDALYRVQPLPPKAPSSA